MAHHRTPLALVATLIACAVPHRAAAQGYALALAGGAGYASRPGASDGRPGYHAGGRILLSANAQQAYGIEASLVDLARPHRGRPAARYAAVGVVLEQRLWSWFSMSIGTIGYVGIGSTRGNPFGLVTSLGWQPDLGRVGPFVAYRADWVFSSPAIRMDSISAGAVAHF